jgi:hypothetical protein
MTGIGIAVVGRLPDSHSVFMNNLQGKPLDREISEIEGCYMVLLAFILDFV